MVASDDAYETKTRLDKSALPSPPTAFPRSNLEPRNRAIHKNSQKIRVLCNSFLDTPAWCSCHTPLRLEQNSTTGPSVGKSTFVSMLGCGGALFAMFVGKHKLLVTTTQRS